MDILTDECAVLGLESLENCPDGERDRFACRLTMYFVYYANSVSIRGRFVHRRPTSGSFTVPIASAFIV